MVVDRIRATSDRIPWRVPVFRGLWPRNRYQVDGMPLMAQPDMAASLPDHRISEVYQHMNQTIGGHAAQQPPAASWGINSSLT
jgi:hypothetical protein